MATEINIPKHESRFFLFLFLLFGMFSNVAGQNWSSGGVLSEYQKSFDIHYYSLNLKIDPDNKFLEGFTDVHVYGLVDDASVIELDLVRNYQVTNVYENGVPAQFSHEEDKLFVFLTNEISKDEKVQLRVEYSGHPPVAVRPPWEGGFNWSVDSEGNHWVGVSCQLEGAKIWFPAKDHPVSRADSVSLNITVPKPYKVASNGLLQERTVRDSDWHTWHWKTRYPIHNYNVSINIGLFETVEDKYLAEDGTVVPVIFYVLPQDKHRAGELLEITIQKLKQMRVYYGEYGFTSEKFGLVQTDYLGMEHQTINSYGNDFRYTVIDGKAYDWLLLHELIHEWWGNLITVSDWADFWIHEGITTYTDALFLWDYFSEETYHAKIAEYKGFIRNHQPIIPGENVTSAEVYNHDVYYKGAYFMHTLSFVMGRGTFMNLLRAFALQNRYQYTSTEELRSFFETYSGIGLKGLFDLYLYSTELPELLVEENSDGKFAVSIPNIDFNLSVEILTSNGKSIHKIGPEPTVIESETNPEVDPGNWYLWRHTFE